MCSLRHCFECVTAITHRRYIRRCRTIGNEKFIAVKRLSQEDTVDLCNCEARMLIQANYHDVPGVVRFVDLDFGADEHHYLFQE